MLATETGTAGPPRGRWGRAAHALLLATAVCDFFSIALMQTLLGLALLAWVLSRFEERGRPLHLPLALLFGAYVLVSAASAVAIWDLKSLYDAVRKGLVPVVLYAAIDVNGSRARLERAGRAVVAGGALASIAGLVEFAVRGTQFRVSGTLGHYMTYSGVVMMAALIALARMLFAPRSRETLFLGVALASMLWALLLTHTRGAWLGLSVGAVLLVAFWRPRALLLLPAMAVALYLLAPGVVKERIHSFADARDETAVERIYMWRAGLAMVADRPLLGIGPGKVRARYRDYRLDGDPRPVERPPGHLHSNPVQVAAERGLIALALWCSIFVTFFLRCARALRRAEPGEEFTRRAVLGGAAALVAFLVMGASEFNYGDSEVVTMALLLMALALGAERIAELAAARRAAGRA